MHWWILPFVIQSYELSTRQKCHWRSRAFELLTRYIGNVEKLVLFFEGIMDICLHPPECFTFKYQVAGSGRALAVAHNPLARQTFELQ